MADLEKTRKNLENRGFRVHTFAAGADAAEYLVQTLQKTSIGIGGSVTVEQMGLGDRLSRENTVFWHWRQPAAEARKNAMAAEVYLLSANAVSETGALVNIDGTGNRVAASLYGREHVIYLVGVNKLAPTLEAAIDRARNVAAPLNARRLHCQTPCALADPMRCHDCHSPDRICKGYVVQTRPMGGIGRTEIFLIGETLGY